MEMHTDVEKAANVEVETCADPPQLSFKQQIEAAKVKNEDNKLGLCFAVCGICLGTLSCKIISLIFSLVPIIMIYLGAANLKKCTIQSFIPIYLVVLGVLLILDELLIYCQCRNKKEESETNKKPLWGRIYDSFVIVWFVVGSVYIYKIYEPNYDALLGEYCDKGTYLFAFWCVTIFYLCCILIITIFCCTLAFLGVLSIID